VLLLLLSSGLVLGNPPLPQQAQDEEYCNRLRVAGTGTIDIAQSVVDRRLGLEYYNFLNGNGDFEMDSSNGVSTDAALLQADVDGTKRPLNLYETSRMTYKGETPLVGFKYINSREFWGGIGAEVQESFSVTEMEREGTTFFASTMPDGNDSLPQTLEELRQASPVHIVGIDVTNSFNGTWETNAHWHKILQKDIKDHQMFSGQFEVKKLLKFHESPVPDLPDIRCWGVDC